MKFYGVKGSKLHEYVCVLLFANRNTFQPISLTPKISRMGLRIILLMGMDKLYMAKSIIISSGWVEFNVNKKTCDVNKHVPI